MKGLAHAAAAVALAAFAPWPAPAADPAAVTFDFKPPVVVVSMQDMERSGLMYPDGTLGVIRDRISNSYRFWAAGGSFSGVGGQVRLPAGTYAFSGTLESFAPILHGGRPLAALVRGLEQPSPDGSDFDRDYAGGGPTYVLALSRADLRNDRLCRQASSESGTSSALLLQIYHGESRLEPSRGLPAVGGSGMALSCNGGATFEKLGEILTPHVSRAAFAASGNPGGMWSDATMVETDALGHAACAAPNCGEPVRFYSLVFTDHNLPAEDFSGLYLARVSSSALLAAVQRGEAPVFRKYYAVDGKRDYLTDHFTEPGLGGRSTPVVATRGERINTPQVLYDPYLQRFLLVYQVNQQAVMLRTSVDLLSWSDATLVFHVEPSSATRVFYPALVGQDADPQQPGKTFQLYFLLRERAASGALSQPRLLREQVTAY